MKLWTVAVLVFPFSLATIIANPNAFYLTYQPLLLAAGNALIKAV